MAALTETFTLANGVRRTVVVCLGDSITAAGWPEMTASLVPPERGISLANRGIVGNRLRIDGSGKTVRFGRSGLNRFDTDVLGTPGRTDVVLALGTNDIRIPGNEAPLEQVPTAEEITAAYQEIATRAVTAGLGVWVATITPFFPADGTDAARERIRQDVNDWIRSHASNVVDFDAEIRDPKFPSQLAADWDSGDHLHPNRAGTEHLARIMADALAASGLSIS